MSTDADFRLMRWDDPDSQNLIRGFRALVWPGAFGLVVAAAVFALMRWPASVFAVICGLWFCAQLCFRWKAFGLEIAAVIGGVLELGARWREVRATPTQTPEATTPALAAAPTGPRAFAAMEAPAQAEATTPRQMFKWAGMLGKLLKRAPLIGGIIAAIVIAAFAWKILGGPISTVWGWMSGGGDSAAELRAEMRTDVAESQTRAAEAGRTQAERAVIRTEEFHTRIDAIETDREEARDAIAQAPDLEARIAAHRAYVERVRDADRAARDAALSDLRSSLDP